MKKNLILLCLCFLSAASLWFAQIRRDQLALAQHIAPEILRFHVIANSNSAEDQEIKLKVKSYLLENIYQKIDKPATDKPALNDTIPMETISNKTIANNNALSDNRLSNIPLSDNSSFENTPPKNSLTKDDLKAFLTVHKEELERDTEAFIRQLGKSYPVSLEVTCCEFPEKTYGNLRLPAGTYETAQLKIGAARGHNWWCVLYPKICITKDAVATVPDSSLEELRQLLSQEDYQKLLFQRPELTPKFHLSFYTMDRLKEWKRSLTAPSARPGR